MYRDKKQKRSFKEFAKELKEDKLNNCILMYGQEQYLVKWAVDTLVSKFVNPGALAMDYIVFDDENASASEIITSCETFSMFSEKRVVWVKNYKALSSSGYRGYNENDIGNLVEYVKNVNPGTFLIFSSEEISEKIKITEAIVKNASIFEYSRLERGELTSFANKRFKSCGVSLSPAVMKALIDETGYFNKESDYRLFNFENDILKVVAHSDGRLITMDDVKNAVSGDLDTFVFDLMDGISGNQKDKAFKLLSNKLNGGEDIRPIVALIVSQFENMVSLKELREDGKNFGDIQKKLKISEYRLKKMVPYTNRYSLEKLKEILSSAYEITWNTNSGLMSGRMAMEMFIAKI